ncbi:hypothetical protein ACFWBF_31995 [Streptomyces sp. NPDC060028]|uniref:hypothetical protein n=1 Tax=Streptomyces sp. NPDC060028 TaxID=3347041 RepID=UPI00367C97E4
MDRLDEGLVVRIAVVLAERGDHLTMGRFVGHMRDRVLGRILEQVGDTAVLRAGFYVDLPERLPRILELMGDDRLGSLVRAAAADGLWEEPSPSPAWSAATSGWGSPSSRPASTGPSSIRSCG